MNLYSAASSIAGITAIFFPPAVAGQVAATALNDRQTSGEIGRLETRIDWEVNRVREEIRKHDLSKDPRFLRSVETAVQLSLQTMQEGKIDLYARILARATADQKTGVLDTAPIVMRAVGAATPDELSVLRTLQSKLTQTRHELDSRELSQYLDNSVHVKNLDILLYGLAQLGLVKYLREKPIENKSFGVWNVTVLGKRVVDLTDEASKT